MTLSVHITIVSVINIDNTVFQFIIAKSKSAIIVLMIMVSVIVDSNDYGNSHCINNNMLL